MRFSERILSSYQSTREICCHLESSELPRKPTNYKPSALYSLRFQEEPALHPRVRRRVFHGVTPRFPRRYPEISTGSRRVFHGVTPPALNRLSTSSLTWRRTNSLLVDLKVESAIRTARRNSAPLRGFIFLLIMCFIICLKALLLFP